MRWDEYFRKRSMVHAFKKHVWESKTRFVVGNVEKNPLTIPR